MDQKEQVIAAQKIRAQYEKQAPSPLEQLKALDAKVKRPAKCFAYVLGTLAALVIGSGMSLVMTDVGATLGLTNCMGLGIVIGVAGLALACMNYPLYRGILKARQKRYASRIIALSDAVTEG